MVVNSFSSVVGMGYYIVYCIEWIEGKGKIDGVYVCLNCLIIVLNYYDCLLCLNIESLRNNRRCKVLLIWVILLWENYLVY